jgi:hypothetical protein
LTQRPPKFIDSTTIGNFFGVLPARNKKQEAKEAFESEAAFKGSNRNHFRLECEKRAYFSDFPLWIQLQIGHFFIGHSHQQDGHATRIQWNN